MPRQFYKAIGIGLVGVCLANSVVAQDSIDERVARLERKLNSQGLVDIVLKLESLQSELQILRGEAEMLTHTLGEIKQRQRDLYLDLDRRILQLERNTAGSTGTATQSGSVAPAAAAATTSAAASAAGTKSAPTSTPTKSTVKTSQTEQDAYQKAFDQLRNLQYEKAGKAFSNFLKKYPNGRYAHIAQYWLGETNYAQRNFKQAIVDYQILIDKYSSSPKLAEAMLKIGYSQFELKNYSDAEKTLQKLIKTYPGTTEAGQAQNLLQKIRLKRGK